MKFIIVIICLFTTSCDFSSRISSSNDIRNSIRQVNSIFIYEGLPHQNQEGSLLKEELKRNKTVKIGEYPFYTPKSLAYKEDTGIIRNALSSTKSFAVYTRGKRCGGFHPDYAIEWHSHNKTYQALLCYGCHEFILIEGTSSYKYDMAGKIFSDLPTILKKYDSKRPKNPK